MGGLTMHDRENVISEIEDALSDNLAKAGFIYGLSLNGLKDKALTDALSMLKEQEAESVIDIVDPVDGIEVGRCPLCDKRIVNEKSDPTRYCKFCGQAVKWE